MPRRLLGSSFIARPMRIIQQRGNETRFGNKMSRETGTRRWWWKRAKVAEQGKFLTYLNRAILPKLYTVDRPRNTWQVDKNSRIQISGERRVEIRNREGRNATTFHETIFETPDKFLLRFTPFIFPSSLFSSPIRAVQRIIPAFLPFSSCKSFFLRVTRAEHNVQLFLIRTKTSNFQLLRFYR